MITKVPQAAKAQVRDERELIPADSPLSPFISVDKGRMHGEPCFKGSRVPVKTLFDHLRAGDPLEVFLKDFPPVTHEQAVGVIDLAAIGLLEGLRNL
ncbi:MAG TPA: DUF433 domain-containing protein [Humisphaera sp.]|jgi:uncharacterized protein (DUF433 family)|nr:DUF433 domain-containing protein [Humisphaera sp.]